MTVEANNPLIEDDDDLNTTAPNPAEDDDLSTTAPNPPDEPVWKMPEPVFRKTSGKLPEGFEKDYVPAPVPQSNAAVESAPAVEAYGAPTHPAVKPKSSVLKLILVLLGIAAMTAFLIVFLTFVYFFFMR